jgi:hypothetical protein
LPALSLPVLFLQPSLCLPSLCPPPLCLPSLCCPPCAALSLAARCCPLCAALSLPALSTLLSLLCCALSRYPLCHALLMLRPFILCFSCNSYKLARCVASSASPLPCPHPSPYLL